MNWRGQPLTSHEVIVESTAATTTSTGLSVHAELDTGHYPTGLAVSDQTIATLPITRHTFHGGWNYTLHPHAVQTTAPASTDTAQHPTDLPQPSWITPPCPTPP